MSLIFATLFMALTTVNECMRTSKVTFRSPQKGEAQPMQHEPNEILVSRLSKHVTESVPHAESM